jgi:hypothetical protein
MALRAVLTGDIVNSTRLKKIAEKKLLKILTAALAAHQFEFYRGDSFQVYVRNPAEALKIALICRTAAISLSKSETISDLAVLLMKWRLQEPGWLWFPAMV